MSLLKPTFNANTKTALTRWARALFIGTVLGWMASII